MNYIVRHLALSPSGDFIASANYEGEVSVWEICSGNKIVMFNAELDFGGFRLAVSSRHNLCFSASFDAGMVTAYNLMDSGVCWQRRDLTNIQKIALNQDESYLYCIGNNGKCDVVDAKNGRLMRVIPKVRNAWRSYDSQFWLYDEGGRSLRIVDENEKVILRLKKESFEVLDACFCGGSVAVSEAAKNVRCFDLRSGQEMCKVINPEGWHVLYLGFNKEKSCFYGVRRNYECGGDLEVIEITKNSNDSKGRILWKMNDVPVLVFSPTSGCIITSEGEILNLSTGKSEKSLW